MMVPRRLLSCMVVLTAVLLQVSVVQRVEFGDVSPDLVVLAIVSLALLSNSVDGAIIGFTGGVAIGLFAALPLGSHALLCTLIGYMAGRWGESLVTDQHPAPPLVAGVLATLAMHAGRPTVEFLVNPAVVSGGSLWSGLAIVTLVNAVLAIPIYALVRRLTYTLAGPESQLAGGEA